MKMDRLHEAVLTALQSATAQIIDEEAKAAAIRVEERVRGLAGQIATKIASHVNYQADRHEVRITVRLPDRDNDPNLR
jgi:hypothetical protein